MLFWLFVILMVVSIGLMMKFTNNEFIFASGMILFIVSAATVIVMSFFLVDEYTGLDADVAKYNARYESLVYQYENNIYDNDNDLGKRELMSDIEYWNTDLAYRKGIQDDFWMGIFYADIYDQFKFIELK